MKMFTKILALLLLVSLPLFSGGKSDESSEIMEKDMMETDMSENKMMEKEMTAELMEFKSMDNAMMLADSDPTVLFFHASWCPSCKTARKDFESNIGQLEGINLLIVDYDSSKELQKKYGVTYQHTFVQISPSGESLVKWNGGGTAELLDKLVKMEM